MLNQIRTSFEDQSKPSGRFAIGCLHGMLAGEGGVGCLFYLRRGSKLAFVYVGDGDFFSNPDK